jgi:hypothetical protein
MTRGTHRLSLALLLGTISAVAMAQPQPAPLPRPIPTTPAELIVGEWKLVKHNMIVFSATVITKYDDKGRYQAVVDDDGRRTTTSGTYRVVGNVLTARSIEPNAAVQPEPGQFQITEITRDHMTLTGLGRFRDQVTIYHRIASHGN